MISNKAIQRHWIHQEKWKGQILFIEMGVLPHSRPGDNNQQRAGAHRKETQVLPFILPMFIPEPNRPMFSIPPPKGPSIPARDIHIWAPSQWDRLHSSGKERCFREFHFGCFLPGTSLPSVRTLGEKMLVPLPGNHHLQNANLIHPLNRQVQRGPERWSDLPKVTELVSEKARPKAKIPTRKDWQVKLISSLKLLENRKWEFMQGLRKKKEERWEKTVPKSDYICTSF